MGKEHDKIIFYLNDKQILLKVLGNFLETTFQETTPIEYTFEYLLEKKFIDLVVHIEGLNNELLEFIIEIKTERDFDDTGDILRQIKTYRRNYNYNKYSLMSNSNIVKSGWDSFVSKKCMDYLNKNLQKDLVGWKSGSWELESKYNKKLYNNRFFCILSTKIPEDSKKLFHKENIRTIEIEI